MKNCFLLVILIPIISFSQVEDYTKDCRELTVKSLMLIYRKGVADRNFNFYVKNNNLNFDAETVIDLSSARILEMKNSNKILENQSKDLVYDILVGMNKINVFTTYESLDCKFISYYFNITYITTDYERLVYTFYVLHQDIAEIKEYINKQDVFLILKKTITSK